MLDEPGAEETKSTLDDSEAITSGVKQIHWCEIDVAPRVLNGFVHSIMHEI